jgi:hypothetical protein
VSIRGRRTGEEEAQRGDRHCLPDDLSNRLRHVEPPRLLGAAVPTRAARAARWSPIAASEVGRFDAALCTTNSRILRGSRGMTARERQRNQHDRRPGEQRYVDADAARLLFRLVLSHVRFTGWPPLLHGVAGFACRGGHATGLSSVAWGAGAERLTVLDSRPM